jgi:hypothetical protein
LAYSFKYGLITIIKPIEMDNATIAVDFTAAAEYR